MGKYEKEEEGISKTKSNVGTYGGGGIQLSELSPVSQAVYISCTYGLIRSFKYKLEASLKGQFQLNLF